jgi:hypothetical protein
VNGFTQFGWALIVAAAVGGPHRLAADNGDVALGVPVEGIEIDGDLSDWPAHMRRYEITQDPTGSPPSDAADFAAWFMAGYSVEENALFVGIEVQDESIVVGDPDMPASIQNWNAADGVEVYVGRNGSAAPPGQWATDGQCPDVLRRGGLLTDRVGYEPPRGRSHLRVPLRFFRDTRADDSGRRRRRRLRRGRQGLR